MFFKNLKILTFGLFGFLGFFKNFLTALMCIVSPNGDRAATFNNKAPDLGPVGIRSNLIPSAAVTPMTLNSS